MHLNLSDLSPIKRYFILSSLVVPRPIAWLTTLNENGSVNAAPFSYFQLLGQEPPLVVFGFARHPGGRMKDSYLNIRRSKEFVLNFVTEENAEQMNLTATDFPPGTSEVTTLGLATEPSTVVKPPRLAIAPAQIEGREIQTILIGDNQVVMGELLVAHIRDEFIDAESLHVRTERMHMIGRLQGGADGGYCRTRDPIHYHRLSFEEWKKRQG